MLLGGGQPNEPAQTEEEQAQHRTRREEVAAQMRAGQLEEELVEVEVEQSGTGSDAMLAMGIDINLNEMMGGLLPKQKKRRRVNVREARRILTQEESEKLIDMDGPGSHRAGRKPRHHLYRRN